MTWGTTTPDHAEFLRRATRSRAVPITRRLLAEDLTPTAAYRAFGGGAGSFILESAEQGEWGRWSFVGVNAPAHLLADGGAARWYGRVPAGLTETGPVLDLIAEAQRHLRHDELDDDFPPFAGGLVGALGWEIVRLTDDLPAPVAKDVDVPDVVMLLATDILAFDHARGEVWLIACAINFNGLAEGADAAYADALARLQAMERTLAQPAAPQPRIERGGEDAEPRYNMAGERFEEIVGVAKDAIARGEIEQVVLARRADLACTAAPIDVYRVLRSMNPSPYMYLLSLPNAPGKDPFTVVGSSPETLVAVRSGHVRTFPIAGTIRRGATAREDAERVQRLLADPKERAEHEMLVDLAQEDLARICSAESITVEEFMAIRRYSHVMHLTSTVTGTLAPEATAIDALTATFPAGTLSGAPRRRSLELIDELEPTRRGLYGGVVGYLDLSGNLDMAIAIRTAIIAGGRAHVQAGAGIVAQSVPSRELDETRNKSAAVLTAVQRANRLACER